MNIIQEVVSLFFIYSFLGWVIEITYVSILNKKFTDRGFLIEPICPIYGVSCVLLTYLFSNLKQNYLLVFLLSTVICTIIEYITGFILEKVFRTKWWDYSRLKFNINGRICLRNSILFGFLGTIVISVVSPYFQKMLKSIPNNILIIILAFLSIVFLLDFIISSIIVHKIKVRAKEIPQNNKKELNEQVKEYIIKDSILYKRVIRAFNDFKMFEKFKRK